MPNKKPNVTGSMTINTPQCPKISTKYTKPKEVIIDIMARDKACIRLACVKRLKTGKCFKNIGIAEVQLSTNSMTNACMQSISSGVCRLRNKYGDMSMKIPNKMALVLRIFNGCIL